MKKTSFLCFVILLTCLGTGFSADLSLQYQCAETTENTNQIKPYILIANNGTSSAALSDITVRYYYTKEGTASEEFHVDYAVFGSSNVIGSFENGYVEIGFTSGAGSLGAGADSGTIQVRLNKSDWSMYDQADDYSFDPSMTSFGPNDFITMYYQGSQVSGIDPGTGTQGPAETPGPTPVYDSFIYLTVIDAAQGFPIDGAEVQYVTTNSPGNIQVLYTDKNGEVAVTLPNIGLGWVSVHALGYFSAENLDRVYMATVELEQQPGFLVHVGMSYGNFDSPFSGLVRYSGDYSGEEAAPFNIGLSQGPFTVTLDLIDTVYAPGTVEYTFVDWQVNGQSITSDTSITLTADGSNPKIFAHANFLDLTPTDTPRPTATPTVVPTPIITQAPDSMIDLTILDGETDLPIDGAVVVADTTQGTMTFTSDENGEVYSGFLTGVGIYNIQISKDGYITEENAPMIGTVYLEPEYVPGSWGEVWINPKNSSVGVNEYFSVEVRANTGVQRLAAYGFDIVYEDTYVVPAHPQDEDVVQPGTDGFIAAVNDATSGTLSVTGFDTTGTGPGTNLHVLTLYFRAQNTPGTSTIDINVENMVDETTNVIGTPQGISGTVIISDTLLGDVNGDSNIDIVDALLTAQYFVGLDPANFNPSTADVNCDGSVDIVDALLMAQYYVGIITGFC